jgi:hypothetical protein
VSAAVTFAVVSGAYLTGHQVGDYWVQTTAQALGKALPGRPGRVLCASHVATYTLTLAASLAVAAVVLAAPVSPARAAAGLAVSGVTHYLADRRDPLARLAEKAGRGGFWRSGEGLASGAAHLDQSWHWLWLFAAALITAS